MEIISAENIRNLKVTPLACIDWVKEAFLIKYDCQLPPKISLHPQGSDLFNTMPCILPYEKHTYGCKIISRIAGNYPAVRSEIMLFNTLTGEMTALINGDWITAMRTGAVAALSIQTFQKSDASEYSFIGLGVTGYATLECFLANNKKSSITVRLKQYKDHAQKAIDYFSPQYPEISFKIVETNNELVEDADVIVSCITEATDLLVKDNRLFKPGCLIIPVHTRGFQNCDTVFDKIFADDEGHVKNFKYFKQFRKFGEFSQVLRGELPGRENDQERILSYNIGISLHDVLFATKILDLYHQSC